MFFLRFRYCECFNIFQAGGALKEGKYGRYNSKQFLTFDSVFAYEHFHYVQSKTIGQPLYSVANNSRIYSCTYTCSISLTEYNKNVNKQCIVFVPLEIATPVHHYDHQKYLLSTCIYEIRDS